MSKPKTIKVNPSQSYIGFKIGPFESEMTVNYRQGKTNTVTCHGAQCNNVNSTGRRLNVSFLDATGKVILERRIYKEYFEKIAQKAGVMLPE